MHKQNNDGCYIGCAAITIWTLAIIINFLFWGSLIWLTIHLLQQAEAF